MQRRWFLVGCGAAALVGCGAPNVTTAPPEAVARAAYRHDGPPALTLYTMINNRTGAGAHTSLMINTPEQRVIFDPAGSVRHRLLTEHNDVLYGITPRIEDFYARAHARATFHAIIQRREVTAEAARRAFSLAVANGPVAQAQCALVTSGILRQVPGFESIRSTWFPKALSDQFGALPGTTTRRLFENDSDDKSVAIQEFAATAAADQ